jgi:rhamnosyltransferase
LALVGGKFLDVHKGASEARDGAGAEPFEEVEFVITSGSLIALSVHAIIGPFREELFIDSVDIDYCFRARAKGYRLIKARKLTMSHAIGASSRHSVLWMNKWTTNHSADRRYYMARNDTVMLHEYGNYRLGLWALKSLVRCLRLCKRILLYEDMKTSKVRAVGEGWWDGVWGHLGPRAQARGSRPR